MNNTRKRGSMNPWTHGIYLLCLCHTQLSCQTSLPNTNYKKQLLPISTQWALNQVQGHAEYRTWCRYTSHAFMKSTLSVVRLKKKKKKEIQRSKFKGLIDFNDLRIGQHSAFADRQELQGAIQNGRLLWPEGGKKFSGKVDCVRKGQLHLGDDGGQQTDYFTSAD